MPADPAALEVFHFPQGIYLGRVRASMSALMVTGDETVPSSMALTPGSTSHFLPRVLVCLDYGVSSGGGKPKISEPN
jgi:hypothetical protein